MQVQLQIPPGTVAGRATSGMLLERITDARTVLRDWTQTLQLPLIHEQPAMANKLILNSYIFLLCISIDFCATLSWREM